jgi:hypothetical protein
MRQASYATAVLVMAATLACSPRDRRETASSLDSAATDITRDVEEGAREAREEFRDYTYDRREEFRREVTARVERLDQEIAELERTTKRGVDKARDSAVVHIREARKSVARSLDRFGAATEQTWDDVKRTISAAVDSLDFSVRAQRPDARPMGGTGPT